MKKDPNPSPAPTGTSKSTPLKLEEFLARQTALFKPNSAVIVFPDGTRARLSEFETYQPDGPKNAPNGILVRLRSGRTILWSVAGSTPEQKAKHAEDLLEGLDQIFGRRSLAD